MARLIDKASVVAEIEKIEADAICEYNSNKSRYAEGSLDVAHRIKHFLDTLEVKEVQEEPVSEDLEEAAEEWDESLYRSDAFKAGAKWQKGQMMKNAIDAELDDVCGFLTISIPYHNGIAGDKVKVIIIKSE